MGATASARPISGRSVVYLNAINGALGYLSSATHYVHEAYQVWQPPFARGSLEQLTETMERAMRQVDDQDHKLELERATVSPRAHV